MHATVENDAVRLIWITPGADELLTYIARVSNPKGQEANSSPEKLIAYFLKQDPPHWSPFDMACACLEVTTTRDMAHQAIRHWSFRFQEFSQRYADARLLPTPGWREARLQDKTNRQHSVELPPEMAHIQMEWENLQAHSYEACMAAYGWALDRGLAKESARVVLQEGLAPTRFYMQGTLRSWITYAAVRTHISTQKEHRQIAERAWAVLRKEVPVICSAAEAAFETLQRNMKL